MKEYRFQKAVPIWAIKREKEMNCELAFRILYSCPRQATPGVNRKVILALAASTVYRVWVNGNFTVAGPARAAHGFYRVDELDLTEYLTLEENVIVVEVVGYNVNTYDTLDQPSFLTAELLQDDVVVSYTGDDRIQIFDLHQRVQRVQRYSFQRAFAECYSLSYGKRKFYTSTDLQGLCEIQDISGQELAIQPEKKYLTRDVGMPLFEKLEPLRRAEVGKVNFEYRCTSPMRDRSYLNIGETLKGFRPEELDEQLSEEGQNLEWIPAINTAITSNKDALFPLKLEDGYGLYEFPYNATGFLQVCVRTDAPCTIYILFDEILCDGQLDFVRMQTCNCFKYRLDIGTHQLMTFAPYVMKYVKVAVQGKCTITQMRMVEYKHPPVLHQFQIPKCFEEEAQELVPIYRAALETYRANSLDVFMDCPSRERAGWLCDSFFTSRVEYVLTGKTTIEKAFLENFIVVDEFPHLPKGMLPMCYPADHNDGNFIPNWAMWFVLELEEYFERSQDRELIDGAKRRVYDLLAYFQAFENEYGLLENLEKWVFVEWSRANDPDIVQNVNYPTNMLYAKMLRTVAKLYDDNRLFKKAEDLRQVIRTRSLQNIFYTDNELRTNEGLINPGNRTEVCQYYAFFTGIATKEEDQRLWEILLNDFGPQRRETKCYPEVAFASAFIGNYLRIELLYQDKRYADVFENIKGYFAGMVSKTGTLWEYENLKVSCNHGFASHVIYWLEGINQTI